MKKTKYNLYVLRCEYNNSSASCIYQFENDNKATTNIIKLFNIMNDNCYFNNFNKVDWKLTNVENDRVLLHFTV